MLGIRHPLVRADDEPIGQHVLDRGLHLSGAHAVRCAQQEDVARGRVLHQRVQLRVGEEGRGGLPGGGIGDSQQTIFYSFRRRGALMNRKIVTMITAADICLFMFSKVHFISYKHHL